MGVDKSQLLLPSGKTMIETVIDVIDSLCRRVVVVGGTGHHRETIADLRRGSGPLAGIEALLASGLDEHYLICPVDIPFINADLLGRLIVASESDASIFEFERGSKVQSLPLRISAGALPVVSSALDSGIRGIHNVLAELTVTRVSISSEESTALVNVNTPEDYASIRFLPGDPSV